MQRPGSQPTVPRRRHNGQPFVELSEPGVDGLRTWRCSGCGNILVRLATPPGSAAEAKCRNCNSMHNLNATLTH